MMAPGTNHSRDFTGGMARSLSHARLYLTSHTPRILFVHGGFHGAWCWSQTLIFLSERGVGAAAIDLRGHGSLSQGENFIAQGIGEMTDDVTEALSTFTEPPFLAGHSLGALVAMSAARETKLRGLILLSPAVPAGMATRQALPRFDRDRVVAPPTEARARKWFLSGGDSVDVTAYCARLCPESPRVLNDCFHDGVAIEPTELECPIFCLSGRKDDSPLHRANQDQAIAARYGARLHVVAASGHCSMLDDGWREAADVIHGWISP